MAETPGTEIAVQGAFFGSLKRNNKQIRNDRANNIAEDTQMIYKRSIEDIEMAIKQMMREQDAMLDLSPTNAMSLVLASDFDSAAYVNKDMELGVKIRNATIKLNIARSRYNYLFTPIGEDDIIDVETGSGPIIDDKKEGQE